MGINHRIDMPNVFPEALLAQVGGGIDKKSAFGGLYINGSAKALVAQIGGLTDLAIAGNNRDSMGSSGSEKADFKVRGRRKRRF